MVRKHSTAIKLVTFTMAMLLVTFGTLACGSAAPAPTPTTQPAAAAPGEAAPTAAPADKAAQPASAAPEKIVTIDSCWMPEFETYIAWKATQEGWDKAEGIELKLHYFESGMAEMEALPAKQWVVGASGGVPTLVGALRHGAYMIGMGTEESLVNQVMVRPDSPILSVTGSNPKYPDVYGSAELVKGKTILTTTVSSAHYAVSGWLNALGLKDSDVVIKNMDPPQCVAAFDSGIGDVVAVWAPHTGTGASKGWKVVCDGFMVDAKIPLCLVADKEFAESNPEQVAKFLKVFMRGVDLMQKEGVNLAADYQKFMKEWGGLDITKEYAEEEIKTHPVFNLQEQLALFDASKGTSEAQQWMQGMVDFFTTNGRFTPEESEKVMKSGFITDKFLKLVK
ncbi:MAG: ABC transporter substrate-binding protein [Chloroflexota bacterium]